MAFLFSELYLPIPDVDLYLKRIEYQGIPQGTLSVAPPIRRQGNIHLDRAPTLDNLKALMHQHLTHIPYGNLDFYPEPKCPSLAIPDIFDKIIVCHGCGGCFEMNLLFFGLLKSFGYTFYPVIVKCLFGSTDPVVPTHCAAIVTIDGARYYADVGLGNSSPVVPVALDDEQHWQPAAISPNYYAYKPHREGHVIVFEGNKADDRMTMVSFVPVPVELVDFIPLNYYGATVDISPVRRGIIVTIFTEDGTAQIVDDVLTMTSGNKEEKRKLKTADEFNRALWEIFGIRYEIDPALLKK